ncbi:MAG: hypothetical protein JW793_14625 [Acidobacteria bacterium]|nr:hypothetical protein [Acidobacteriota bacterium]
MNTPCILKTLLFVTIVFLFHPGATQAEYLSVPAAALLPKDSGVTWSTNGVYLGTASGTSQSYHGPVFLPHQAVIRSFTLEAADNSSDVEFGGYVLAQLNIYRYNTVGTPVEIQTDGPTAPGEVRVTADNLNISVDNSEFSYGITVILNNGTGGAWSVLFHKIIIEYDLPTSGHKVVVIPLP